jgi:aspartyl/asparaginyl beta-hydroxylase (cupin superfamily)
MNNHTVSLSIGIFTVLIFTIVCTRPRWYLRMKSHIYKPKMYDISDFPELAVFKDHFREIRDEFLTITQKINYDAPRPQTVWSGEHEEETQAYLNKHKHTEGWVSSWQPGSEGGNKKWMNFPLYALGHRFEKNLTQVPKLAKLLSDKPYIRIAGFSKLLPGAKIPNHVDSTGMPWGTIAYHLGVDIPEKNKCDLVVDGEKFYQKHGDYLIFESTYEHSACNPTNKDRTILYIEVDV